jgi:hypothetical protein
MARTSNIFHNLVTDEGSTTELLCNLMRFAAFRRPLLARFLSDACAAQIGYEDIDTQVDLESHGRPDLIVRNDGVCALVEVKVTEYQRELRGIKQTATSHFCRRTRRLNGGLSFLFPRDGSILDLSSSRSSFSAPLTWASWHLRPASLLRKLCYGDFSIHADNPSTYDHGVGWGQIDPHSLGKPHV